MSRDVNPSSGNSASFGLKSRLSVRPRRRLTPLRNACKTVAENLESRLLLSTTSDGFTASFYEGQFTAVTQFPASGTYTNGNYATHLDTINTPNGSQSVAPADAPATFNPNGGAGNPGLDFSGHFSTTVQVLQSGYYTFYPTTDDGAQINIDGTPAGGLNLGVGRGPTQDTDAAPTEWLDSSSHTVDFYYNNGGGGWAYELRWSATSGPNGSGSTIIPYSLMTSAGVPGVANLQAPVPTIAPAAPTMTGATAHSISLTWSSHDVDAASYIVERSATGAAGSFTAVNSSSPLPSPDGGTLTYIDTGLASSTNYFYEIVSNSNLGSTTVGISAEPASAATEMTTAASNPTLAQPTFGVVPGAGGNVLTVLEVANATAYNILRSSTVNGTYTQVGSIPYSATTSTLTFTDTGNSAASFYEIQAVDSSGDNATSAPATLGRGDGFGASFYAGDFNGGGTFSSTTVFKPSTLAASPTYSTIIPAINSGPFTNVNTPPYAPANFNIVQGSGNQGNDFSVEFDFTVVAPYSEKFTFLPRTDDGVQLTVDGAILDAKGTRGVATDTAVVPTTWAAGSTHTIQMAYFNGGGGWESDLGWTSPSLAALYPAGFYGSNGQVVPSFDASARGIAPTATPTTPSIADAPVLSLLSFSATSVQLSFTSSEGDSYNVYRGTSSNGEGATPIGSATGGANTTPGLTTFTYSDPNLTTGTTYYYFVAAVNSSGVGLKSNEISVTPLLIAPQPATNVTAVTGGIAPTALSLGGTGPTVAPITVSWTGSPNAMSYDVLRAPVTGGVAGTFATVAQGITTTSYVDNTAAFNSEYQYEILARNQANPTGASPGSTSAPSATAHNDQGALEEFYYNSSNWGGATDNGDTKITGIVGNPNDNSVQPTINFADANQGDAPPGGISSSPYSTLFTGKVHITAAGAYTFFSNTDDDGILYVDGALVAAGSAGSGTINNATILTLSANTSYDFQFFMEQGGGGQRFEFFYKGPDTSNSTVIVPQTALIPATGAPLTATNVVATLGTGNAAGTTDIVNVTFTDNSDNEMEYQLQRSSDSAFDAAGNVVTVATSSFVYNGVPQANGAITPGAGTIADPSAPAGNTFYYRVVAANFDGSTQSASSLSMTTPPSSGVQGLEVNYFNNEWWRSSNQTTSAIVTGGVGSATNATSLTSDEEAVLPNINYLNGTDGGSGTLLTNATNAKYPDPNSLIGPDDFSDVFTGKIQITTAGTYTFSLNSDDDGYLYVDDQLVSTYPGGHGPGNAEAEFPIVLTAGKHDIEAFHSNGGGGWAFQMSYSGPDTSNSTVVVPTSALATLGNPLVAPTTFTAAIGAGAGQVNLTWSNNNTSAVRYVVQRSTDPSFNSNVTSFDVGLNGAEASATPYPTTTTFTDSGLTTNTTYYYRIAAQNFDGTSATASTSIVVPPGPPVGVVALWSGSNISVTWVPDAGAATYNVYRSTTPGGEGATPIATGLTSPSYLDSSVSTNNTYYYEITAVSSASLVSQRSFETASQSTLPSSVIISEFQASNKTTLADTQGDYPDWLELYNPTASTVNLNGYFLTDKASNPTEWQIPAVSIASGAFMVIFCDGTNVSNPAAQLHTNFSLSASGEYVALVSPGGNTVLSSYTFPAQPTDLSYGIGMATTSFGGSTITSYGAIGYLSPTPGAQNGNILGTGTTAEPTFDHAGGFYTSSFQLAMSDTTAGAAIYYTTDGTLPSATNGTLYTAPITISGETALRAVAIGPDDLPSNPNVDTFIYTSQVITQGLPIQSNGEGTPPPGWPASWGAATHYGMNPAVVNNPLYSGEIQSDLLDIPSFELTLNLSELFDPSTGIYANPGEFGSAWTRPASIQYILPSGAAGFTANAGIAIKGGASANPSDVKHGIRLEFSNQYGQDALTYPLFGNSGATSFQEVDLRTDQNNSWQYSDPSSFVGIRDEFSNATQAALGLPGERSQICFLYINGVFWGLYDAVDRPDASWAANTYGGTSDDYDAIKSGNTHDGYQIEATDGTLSAWDELMSDFLPVADGGLALNMANNANYYKIQGLTPTGQPDPNGTNLLDVANLAQYILLTDYVGNLDGPNSTFINNNPNNFYAVRPIDGSFGFQFAPTDSEWTLLDINTNRVNSDTTTDSLTYSGPQYMFQALEASPIFKQLVANDIQKDFFNNGPLTSSASLARFQSLASQVYGPVVEESARWGDATTTPATGTPYTYTRDVDWQNEINRIENNYITTTSGQNRSQIVLGQLEAVGLFPSTVAPTFSKLGGIIAAGYQLTITNPNSSGSLYYTLDGSDPFNGSVLSPTAVLYTGAIVLNTTTEVKAQVLIGSTWSGETDATFEVPITGLRVTELDYDPPTPPGGTFAGDDDEFIELKNFGTQPVDLDGAAFTNGITYTFGNVTLAPGQAGVLVSNATAFAALYGNSINVLGSYQASTTHFSNSGEEVTLVDATGATITDFTYSPSWYPITAGGGPSLEVVNPASNPNLNLAASWRPSPEDGGTPGVDDSIPTAAPGGLVSAIVNGQVALTWNAVAGAASYNVYRGSSAGGEGTTPYATGLTTTGFTDAAVAGGSTYYYTVAAVDPGGTSSFSNETFITVPQMPVAPVITTQPANQIVDVGAMATFVAAAGGFPAPTVQWNVSTDGGTAWTPINGATSPTYSFLVTSATPDGSEYQAVFTNSQGSVPTTAAKLTTIGSAITAWNFDTSDKTGTAESTKGTNFSPDPSIGSGTSSSIGMALFGTGDDSGLAKDPGSSDGNASTQQAWKVVGTNGWNSGEAIGTQGAQFLVSTVGYSSISLQFDLDVTTQGEGNFAVEYTTNGGSSWLVAPSLSTNGASGISVKTNTTSPNTIQGQYFSAFNAAGTEVFYNRLTADFNGVAGVANNPNFGVRLVNASTGADCVNLSGVALNNTSGNWRFDEVDINGAVAAPTGLTAAAGVSTVTLNWNPSPGATSYDVYRGTTPGGEGSTPLATAVASPTYTDSTAVNGQVYYYTVTAVVGGMQTAASNEVSATPMAAPHITAVYVGSDAWQPAFLSNLATQGLGSATYGYAIPAGSGQSTTLPWINLDQVSVSFDQPIAASSLQQASMALVGTTVPTYTMSAPVLSADGMTITWTITGGLGDDRLELALAGVANGNGTQMDGSWSNGASSFPSGNGTAGSAFDFTFNVLPGDVNASGSVDIVDTVSTRNRQFTAPGSANYSPFYDVNGDGSISIVDTIDVRNRQFTSLPSGTPSLPQSAGPLTPTLPVSNGSPLI